MSPTSIERRMAALARAAFIAAAIAAAAVLARSLLNFEVYTVDGLAMALAFGVPGVGLLVALTLACASPSVRTHALLIAVCVGGPIYAMEAYLGSGGAVQRTMDLTRTFAERAGRPVDLRTPLDVLADEAAAGRAVLPTVSVSNVPFHHPETGPAFVRGSVAGARSLGGNESGTYLFYENDERGYKNPPGLWASDTLDLIAVGDSFTHATSVAMEDDIVGVVRETFPASLNLGWNGIGPLYYYQTLIEYAVPLKPRFVAFLWFEGNDVTDLIEEESTPLLARFIGRVEPLGLYRIPDALDAYHRNRLDIDGTEPIGGALESIRQFVMLYNLRKTLGLGAAGARVPGLSLGGEDFPPLPSRTLERLLIDAKTVVEGWGGSFVFVYLPSWERICPATPGMDEYCDPIPHDFARTDVLTLVRRLDIPLLDMTAPLIEAARAGADVFFYPGSHYAPAGYRHVGVALTRTLERLEAETP